MTYPGDQGATNWYPPTYSPHTGIFYVSAWDDYGTIYKREETTYEPGRFFVGGGFTVAGPVRMRQACPRFAAVRSITGLKRSARAL